ncbi:MAG: glycoside hydrolase family 36 protein [Planctomycetota bacterium]
MKNNMDSDTKSTQRTVPSMLAIALALAFAVEVVGAEVSIENESLQVVVQSDRNIFELTWRESGKVFVDQARFAHRIKSMKKNSISDPVWGRGQEIAVEHESGWQSTLRLFPGNPFVHLHTTVHNSGPEPYVSASERILQFQVDLGIPPDQLRSYGTGFLNSLQDAPGSFSFTAVVDPNTRNGVVAACLTHERGSGVFFTEVKNARPNVRARIDFGRYQVDPGQSRQTETLLIGYFDDARLGLEAYADAVARLYSIKLRPQPSVYCTWYHARASNEEKLLANGEFARRHLKPFGFSVVQIDDQWQARFPEDNTYDDSQKNFKGVGPVKVFLGANENFPKGMKYTAEKLRGMGLIPGIWFMPFAGTWNNPYFADKQDLFAHWPDGTAVVTRWSGSLLDMSNPRTQAFVRDRARRIADWGYGYFKLDGMHTGTVTHNVYVNTGYATSGRWLNSQNFVGDQQAGPGAADVATPSTVLADPRMTHIEAYRKGLEIVRESAPDVFILGCNVSQNMRSMGAAFGLIDAMRIGPDNGGAGSGRWNDVMVGPHHGSNLYFLNRRIWHNDPDPIYVRPSNPLNAARLMASWVAVSGSMLTTSYQFSELPDERLDILKRLIPGHEAVARPVDLFESKTARIWLLTDARRSVRRDVIGLFNWKEKEPDTIVYDMGKLGLNPKATYVAFDYWADKFTEPIRGTLVQTLEPGSCRILAVRPAADYPQLISTSRHITQGIIDVLDESWDEHEKTLSGRSLVVGGDPYELRVALPQDGSWEVTQTSADGANIKLVSATKQGVRLLINSSETREVSWKLTCRTSARSVG